MVARSSHKNVSLLNDLKTAYHHGDQAASEAVGKLEAQNILYYQLIKK